MAVELQSNLSSIIVDITIVTIGLATGVRSQCMDRKHFPAYKGASQSM